MSTALRIDSTPTPGAARRVLSDYRDVQRRLAALSRIASRLPRSTSEVELLTEVVDSLLDYFDGARLVEVFVADGDWKESRLYCRERGGELHATQCGGIEALPESHRNDFAVPRLIAGDGARGPMMSAPVLEGVTLLGLVVIEGKGGGDDFSDEDYDALAGVAAQVSMAIQQLRTSSRQRRSRMVQRDLEAARRIQRSFLPSETAVNGFRFATEYRPAFDVGGDFYDVLTTGPGQLVAVIGDVAGKGVAGALMMSRVSSEIRRMVGRGAELSPRQLLTELNESFSALGVDDSFVTAACVKLDKNARRLTVANAGHVLPLVRRSSGAVMPLGRASGPPVGMLPGQSYNDDVFPLDAGDIVLLMTDGVLDSLHRDDDQLGMWSVIDLLSKAPRDLDEINRRILSLVHQRTGGSCPDDLTLLALEVRD